MPRSDRFRSVPWALVIATAAVVSACGDRHSGAPDGPSRRAPWPGIEVENHTVRSRGDTVPLLFVRLDPRRFRPVLLTAARDGGGQAHTLEQWSARHGLVAAINASMYLPNLRSTGLMVDGSHRNNPAVNARFEGFLAFGARDSNLAPVELVGRDCPGFDLQALREHYKTVLQNYRLLDCEGEAIDWADRKQYSIAGIGLDQRGWVVLIHSRRPCRTADLARWIAEGELGLQGALFVEGGNEAALYLREPGRSWTEVGGYERTYRPGSAPPRVPNIIGFRPVGPDPLSRSPDQ